MKAEGLEVYLRFGRVDRPMQGLDRRTAQETRTCDDPE